MRVFQGKCGFADLKKRCLLSTYLVELKRRRCKYFKESADLPTGAYIEVRD